MSTTLTEDLRTAIKHAAEEAGSHTALAARIPIHGSVIGKYISGTIETIPIRTLRALLPHIAPHMAADLINHYTKLCYPGQTIPQALTDIRNAIKLPDEIHEPPEKYLTTPHPQERTIPNSSQLIILLRSRMDAKKLLPAKLAKAIDQPVWLIQELLNNPHYPWHIETLNPILHTLELTPSDLPIHPDHQTKLDKS